MTLGMQPGGQTGGGVRPWTGMDREDMGRRRNGAGAALHCSPRHFLIRPGPRLAPVSSAFSIAMVFITRDTSFPAQLLKPAAPTHLQPAGGRWRSVGTLPGLSSLEVAPQEAQVIPQSPAAPPRGPDHATV